MVKERRRIRWRRRRERQPRPLIHLVPNAFTVTSICFGLTAIRYGLDQRYELAVVLIILAGIFDGLDGRAARMLKITSKLGAELDSLADFLSFGVAPAFLIYLWSLHQVPGFGWAIALLYVICAALRLARFNSELEAQDRPPWHTRFFTGMPAPAAAGCVIVPMMLAFALEHSWPQIWAINAVVTVFIALMMVSQVPTFSIKMITTRVKPEYIVPTMVGVGVIVTALVNVPWWTLLTVAFIYLLTIPLSILAVRRLRHEFLRDAEFKPERHKRPEPPDAAEDAAPLEDPASDLRVVNLGRRANQAD